MLYPTTFEGFGFIPFEAAEAGAPALWASQSSMADLLPGRSSPGSSPWDADASAAALRSSSPTREPLVAAVRAAAAQLTWDRCAEQSSRSTATPRPPRAASPPSPTSPSRTSRCRSWARAAGCRPDDQLALLAVSARPALKRTVFSALRGGYRAMYRLRRVSSNGD